MNDELKVGEKQYQESISRIKVHGNEKLGLMSSWGWQDDPKRLGFTLARYKFVAKMLINSDHVLEIGCADAFATRVVRQAVKQVTAIDFDPSFIEDAKQRSSDKWNINFLIHDLMKSPVPGNFDGVYSLDVLEHINPEEEEQFLRNMIESLNPHGTAIIGMPSLNSQNYASIQSRLGHVNCKQQNDLRNLMKKFFHNVYMFSMNDEVVHTGFDAMAHYHLALCCGKK